MTDVKSVHNFWTEHPADLIRSKRVEKASSEQSGTTLGPVGHCEGGGKSRVSA